MSAEPQPTTVESSAPQSAAAESCVQPSERSQAELRGTGANADFTWLLAEATVFGACAAHLGV